MEPASQGLFLLKLHLFDLVLFLLCLQLPLQKLCAEVIFLAHGPVKLQECSCVMCVF